MLSGSERGYDPAQVCALLSNAFVINNNFLVVRDTSMTHAQSDNFPASLMGYKSCYSRMALNLPIVCLAAKLRLHIPSVIFFVTQLLMCAV